MYGFIYITTNLVNGTKYLGQRKYSNGWEDYLGSGLLLTKALRKYGKENFKREIIAEAKTREELNQLEYDLIEKYGCRTSGEWYNIFKGGMGGSLKGEDSQNFGRVQTEDHKSKISQGMNSNKLNIPTFIMEDLETGEKIEYESLGAITLDKGHLFRKAASVHLGYKKDKVVKLYKGRYKFYPKDIL